MKMAVEQGLIPGPRLKISIVILSSSADIMITPSRRESTRVSPGFPPSPAASAMVRISAGVRCAK